nr:ribonuclease H-like domain, reverse transcriptase, RNA-dependent DNA polymerase [Tanacetum cinerariifolium]
LMKDKFQMSLMGELTFFLGLQVKQKEDRIFINQDNYVAEILKKFGLTEGKSGSTPIDIEKPLLKDPDGEDVDVHIYRSLMYLTSSRPDIMFAFKEILKKGQNRIKTRQKREAWQSQEKLEAVTVDRAGKTKQNVKRRAVNANTVKVHSSLKKKEKRKGLKLHLCERYKWRTKTVKG